MGAVRTRRRERTIRDFIEADAWVVATEGFRPMMGHLVERGARHRLTDAVVREWPQYFAILVPVERFLSEIEIER